MKNHGVSTAIALFLLPVAHGQAVKDPQQLIPVRVSSRAN
jgi:hypothetical protein